MAKLNNIFVTTRQTSLTAGVNKNILPSAQEIDPIINRLNSITDNDNVLTVDTISEYTAANGVVVDGVTIKDGVVTTTGINNPGAATGITAFAGGGQGSATALASEFNEITTCATEGDSVGLPTAVRGLYVVVKNSGATAAEIFPASGDSIDAGGGDSSIELAVGASMSFRAVSNTVWESSLPGAGDVGFPSLPVGSTDTGLYEVSATQTGFAQDGTLVAVFDSNGINPDGCLPRVQPGTQATGTTALTYGDGKNFTTTITLSTTTIAIAGAAAEGNGVQIYTFPAGAHIHEVTYMDIDLQGTGTVDADTPEVGIGSVVATGAVSALDTPATFEDYITGTAAADCNGTNTVAMTAATAGYGTGISLNVAANEKKVFLNVADTWAGADTITATGTVVLKWTQMA